MKGNNLQIEIVWTGPYAWPAYERETGLPPIPVQPGVYLQTIEYHNGYLIYAAGITRRTVPERFREHTRNYLSGEYNVLDVQAMCQGLRREIWRGWGWSPEKRAQFAARQPEILDAARRQLAAFRIFVADVGCEERLLERIEAAIMNNLYRQASPFCDIPDKGMMLAPRWASEAPLVVSNSCAALLHQLPKTLEI